MIMRPKQFYIIALALIVIGISFPLQVMFLYGHDISEWASIMSKITTINWLVIGSIFLLSYLHLKASKWLVVAAPATIILVGVNNYIVGQFAGDYSMTQAMVASGGFSFLFLPLFMQSSKLVLKDPKRRWWVRSKRYNRKIPTTINPFVGDMVQAHTFDISETGAFVSFEGIPEEDLPKVGERIRVSFTINSMKKIRCEAVVVRQADAVGRYPQGVGLRFIDFDKLHMKSFQKILKSSEEYLM